MPYFRRRNAFLSGSAWPVGAVLGVVILIFLILRLVAPDALMAVARPLWQTGDALTKSTASVALPFTDVAALKADYDRLLMENESLRNQNAVLMTQVRDTSALTEGIPAGVLSHPPVSPYDTLVVAAGSQQGVRQDAFVYAPGGVPVGVVETVNEQTSRVILYTTPGRTTEGWVGDARLPISLIGKGAGAFQATLPRESGIEPGAVVYLPGPGALPVGTVVRIDSDPSSPRSVVHVRPVVNPFSITWVSIAP